MKIIVFPLLFILCVGCNSLINHSNVSLRVRMHLNEVIGIMNKHSINTDQIDWEEFEGKVFNNADGAQNINDNRQAIQLAINLLNDHHSIYITEDEQLSNIIYGMATN